MGGREERSILNSITSFSSVENHDVPEKSGCTTKSLTMARRSAPSVTSPHR
jgi:hypothetical protein